MRGGGVLRALGVTIAGAALVAGASVLDTRYIVDGAPRQAARAEPGRSAPLAARTLVCPGPETLGVAGLPAGSASAVDLLAASPPAGVAGAVGQDLPAGTTVATGLPARQELRRITAAGEVLSAEVTGATSAAISATGRLAPGLAAAQLSLVREGERSALASTTCGEPTAEAWLLAGSGQAGRQEHLVLTNPHDSAVTVDVTLEGVKGPVIGVAGQGIVVEPHGRTVVLLDALDGAELSPAAHVVVRGGTVHATLRDTWLDGIVSRGADDVTPSVAGAALVIPGLAVAGEGDPMLVRVAAPGSADADVRLTVLGPQGPVGSPTPARRVRAGTSVDLGLPALPAGVYSVQVDSGSSVVASGYVGRADGERPAGAGSVDAPVHDLAWSAAAPPLTDLSGLPLARPEPGTLTRRLAVTNPTGQPVTSTVTLVGADGRPQARSVRVPARATGVVDLGDATSVWLSRPGGGTRAAVVTEAEGGLVTVTPLPARSQSTVPYVLAPGD